MLEKIHAEKGDCSERAAELIALIKDPSKMQKANEQAFLGTPYLYRSNDEHMLLIVMPKSADITYLKLSSLSKGAQIASKKLW